MHDLLEQFELGAELVERGAITGVVQLLDRHPHALARAPLAPLHLALSKVDRSEVARAKRGQHLKRTEMVRRAGHDGPEDR